MSGFTAKATKCAVDGCEKPLRAGRSALCNMHYTRHWRTGSTDLNRKDVPEKRIHSNGYILVHAPEHPLSNRSRVYEHRLVYYNAYGVGPFACVHCGKVVAWDSLHIDHLNEDKTDNGISNLAASCPRCNMSRSGEKLRSIRIRRFGLEFGGEVKLSSEWAQQLGISTASLRTRLAKGWSIERALTERRGVFGPKSHA